MIKIKIKNSLCEIKGIDSVVLKQLKRVLSYRPEGYFFVPAYKLYRATGGSRGWNGWICMTNNQGIFQTGLLKRVQHFLKTKHPELEIKIIDRRKIPTKAQPFKLVTPMPTLRDYQTAAVDAFMLGKGRGVIALPTGTGKSLIFVECIRQIGRKTLVIAPNTSIMHQLHDTMVKYFGQHKVGIYYGVEKNYKPKIIVGCIDSLMKIPDHVYRDIQFIVNDEAHHQAAETHQKLNKTKWNDIYYRLCATATWYRNDGSEMAMEAIVDNVVYEMSIAEAIEKGWLVPPSIKLYQYTQPFSGIKQYQQAYKAHIVENEERNRIIAKIAQKAQEKQSPTIIMVKEINHGKLLKELIPNSVFVHGITPERQETLEKFRQGKIHTIIATSILGEGVDLPCLQTIIIAHGMKAESDLVQKIGRALRIYPGKKKAFIFDIYDKNNRFFERQAATRLKVFEKNYGDRTRFI